jgi:methionyl-tRNA formyltransferase
MSDEMKLIFFGSSDFAVKVLDALLKSGYPLISVVTQPDKKAGRHLHLAPTAVKLYAQAKKIAFLCPSNLSQPEFLKKLSDLKADLFVVVSYGKILPDRVLSLARLYALNIHASLLPYYRGAAPIQRALLAGEKVTGITVIRMNEKMDEGDIVSQAELEIENADNTLTLEDKLNQLACSQILSVLELAKEGKLEFRKQDSLKASIAEKLTKADGVINWKADGATIYNQIRACIPWPVAYTLLKGKRVKIFAARLAPELSERGQPGQVVSLKDSLIGVATGKGNLVISELQPENARRLSAKEFISGAHLQVGLLFGR